MRFGIMFANTGFGASPDGAIALAQAAEAGGFETLWAVEHVVVPSGYESKYPYDPSGKMAGGAEVFDLPDPLIWLTWVAAHTERIRLATGIMILPQRNPVVTAKAIATLDHVSGGRVTLGVGAGWLAEEYAAIGAPFRDRGSRLDEYIDVLRELWAPSAGSEKSTIDGRYVQFTDCIMRPRPVNGTVPIVVGGHTPAAAKRAGRRGDGFFPAGVSLTELGQLFTIARMEAELHDRDPRSIDLYAGAAGKPGPELDEHIEQLAGLGVRQAVLPAFPPDELPDIGAELLARYGA
jgi:probable F420-dependent oxidoreductase